VSLVVSKGPDAVNVTVPNVVNQTQAAAQSAITGAGLTVGAVTQQFSSTVPAGQVISQNPAAGASVASGAAVSLVVSKGPETTPGAGAWSGVRPLSSVLASNRGVTSNDDIDLATDGAGTWVAAISTHNSLRDVTSPELGTDSDIIAVRSTDNGATWDNVLTIVNAYASEDNGVLGRNWDEPASIATDGRGKWVIIWQSDFGPPPELSHSGLHIYCSVSEDNGATWSAHRDIVPPESNDFFFLPERFHLDLAFDGVSTWIAVWSQSDPSDRWVDNDIYYATSSDGFAWSPIARVDATSSSDTDRIDDKRPRIECHNGNCMVVWYLHVTPAREGVIRVAALPASATDWQPRQTITVPDAARAIHPAVATDGQHWITVWEQRDGTTTRTGTDFDIYFAYSDNQGASWSSPAPLNTNAGSDSEDDILPVITAIRPGQWVALWESNNRIEEGPGISWKLQYATSSDGGRTWSAPAVLIRDRTSSFTDSHYEQRLFSDRSGRAIAVWSSNADFGDQDIPSGQHGVYAILNGLPGR
jgi:Neuraminidase (sialidase)